jgi:hypothetical protein
MLLWDVEPRTLRPLALPVLDTTMGPVALADPAVLLHTHSAPERRVLDAFAAAVKGVFGEHEHLSLVSNVNR